MIAEDHRNDKLFQANLGLLPYTSEEARDAFFKSLQKPVEREYVEEIQETDFEAIDRVKAQLAKM